MLNLKRFCTVKSKLLSCMKGVGMPPPPDKLMFLCLWQASATARLHLCAARNVHVAVLLSATAGVLSVSFSARTAIDTASIIIFTHCTTSACDYRLSSSLSGLQTPWPSLRSGRYIADVISFKAGQLINNSHKPGQPASKPAANFEAGQVMNRAVTYVYNLPV